MLNPNDLYTFQVVVPLPSGGAVGTAIIRYEVHRYRDVMNLTETFAYEVICTQRVVIPNAKPYVPGATDLTGGGLTEFAGYPAVLTSQIAVVQTAGQGGQMTPEAQLLDYSPRTLNASVSTSISNSSASSAAATVQHTSGSSTAQTNSFEASATLGFFGSALTGGVSVSEGRSSSIEHSRAHSSGRESGANRQTGGGESMTVKDWACYSYLGLPDDTTVPPSITPNLTTVNWVWGQQYPWDVIQFRYSQGQGATAPVTLPNFVTQLLYDGTQLFPPSQLAQFGIDFTMKAVWRVKPQDAAVVSFTHAIGYLTATHSLNGQDVEAAFGSAVDFPVYTSPALDLCLYGLDPLGPASGSSSAIVGFIPRRFLVAPVAAALDQGTIVDPTPFTILSAGNNLLVQDTTAYAGLTTADVNAGFTASPTALTATFTQHCTTLQLTVSFKVTDTVSEYWLFIKHWKTGATGVVLTITINGDAGSAITQYVDAEEAEGGQDNLLSLSLRDLNYGSIDYHDFLTLGLNTITVAMAPIGGDYGSSGYQVRAVSVERRP
jgi:hypothetical protein